MRKEKVVEVVEEWNGMEKLCVDGEGVLFEDFV